MQLSKFQYSSHMHKSPMMMMYSANLRCALSLHVHPNVVYVNSECIGEPVHLLRLFYFLIHQLKHVFEPVLLSTHKLCFG